MSEEAIPQQRTFVLYRPSGVIQQVCTAIDPPVVPDGLLLLAFDGLVSVDGYHVQGGELVAGPLDDRTLPEIKEAKNREINAARLLANRTGFLFAGKLIASDELSRGDIDAVAAIVARTGALPAGWPGAWKATDNSFVPIVTVAAWDAFYGAMYAAGLQNFATAQGLKAQLADASTPAEIDSITWPKEAP